MESFQKIEETGEWWLQEGWHTCKSFRREKYTTAEIESAIEILKPIFSAEWFRNALKETGPNILTAQLIYTGPPSNDFLVDLSLMIHSLRDVAGLRAICERLKGSESESALFEIEMAGIFSERKIPVEFPARGIEKSPDLIVHFPGESVAIECKHLKKEQWEIWMGELHSAVHQAATRIRPDLQFKIQLHLDPTLSDIHFDDEKEPAINKAIYTAILSNVSDVVDKALQTGILPVEFEISSLVNGTIFPADSQVEESTTGTHISTTAKLRRIFTNAFLRAEKQLPKDLPGIVAVYSDYPPDPPFARIVFDAVTKSQPERFKHIVALLVFPLQTYFRWTPPLLLDNKYSSVHFDKLQCSGIIKDSFGAVSC